MASVGGLCSRGRVTLKLAKSLSLLLDFIPLRE
jgi:hypothetical protein